MSIGIALAPTDGTRPEQLLRNADLALYRAKADGRSVYRFFDDRMTIRAGGTGEMEEELKLALERNELVLHYQPQVNSDSGEPTGFEALIRWNHPERGLVSPADIITVAEQSGLMAPLATGPSKPPAWRPRAVARPSQRRRQSLAEPLPPVRHRPGAQGALARAGLDPRRLQVEITEALMQEDADAVWRSCTRSRLWALRWRSTISAPAIRR